MMSEHQSTPKASPVARTGTRIAIATAMAVTVLCIMVGRGSHGRAQDKGAASDALSVPKSWIIDGDRDDAFGAAHRIDYFMQASSLGVVSGPAADFLEGNARAIGEGHRSRPAAVIALRPHARQDNGTAALAIQSASAPGRPCIDQAEGLMPLAMQVGEVRRIGFACMPTDGGPTARGECEAVADDGAHPNGGADLATPVRFADDRRAWMLVCRLTP